MRIVYVIERLSGTGGLQRILTDKMNYLAEHTAHEIVLMTVWHNETPLAFELSDKIKRIKLNVPLLNIPGGYLATLPLALYRFNKYIKKLNPSIAIFFRAIGAFLVASTTWKGKKIFESHSAYTYSNHRWLYPPMQRKADVVVTLTKGDAVNFKHARKVEVIPNYCTLETRDIASLESNRVIAVGRLCKEKNFQKLIDAWRIIANNKDMGCWTLNIYGDGPLRKDLQAQIDEYGLGHSIKLCGNVLDIKQEYLKSSMLAMTSLTEGMPMVIIEAMTCGLPVIAIDCPYGPSEMILDGETGYLIKEETTRDGHANNTCNDFANALYKLMSDSTLRKQMGRKAKDFAAQYNKPAIMSKWLNLFAHIS